MTIDDAAAIIARHMSALAGQQEQEIEQLKHALVVACIPLEALWLTEMDGTSLSAYVKAAIEEGLRAKRFALGAPEPSPELVADLRKHFGNPGNQQ